MKDDWSNYLSMLMRVSTIIIVHTVCTLCDGRLPLQTQASSAGQVSERSGGRDINTDQEIDNAIANYLNQYTFDNGVFSEIKCRTTSDSWMRM